MAKQIRTVKAGSLHFSNLDKKPSDPSILDDSDTVVKNAADAGLLVDPENTEAGSTHFSNLDKQPKARGKLRASAGKKLRAMDDANDGEALGDEDDDGFSFDQDDNGEVEAGAGIGAIDNDVNPAIGYLDSNGSDTSVVNADLDEDDDGAEDDGQDDDLEADGLEWDKSEDGEGEGNGDELPEASDDEDADDAATDVDADVVESPEDTDALPISDIRKLDDTIDNVAFVMHAGNLLAIKGTTVVAHMTKVTAKRNGIADVYGTKTFAGLMMEECKKHGLSAALRGNNFRTERIDFTASKVVAQTVASETKRIQARVQKQNELKATALDQSVAIAAVGLSRNFFKGVENPLRAALETELTAAGVRNPGRFLQKMFAVHGAAYIKSTMELANKIAAKSEDVRADYCDALDLTSEAPDESVGDENVLPIVKRDGGGGEDGNFEFDGDDEGEDDVPAVGGDITAALMRHPARRAVTASTQNLSANALASAMLRGEVPMF